MRRQHIVVFVIVASIGALFFLSRQWAHPGKGCYAQLQLPSNVTIPKDVPWVAAVIGDKSDNGPRELVFGQVDYLEGYYVGWVVCLFECGQIDLDKDPSESVDFFGNVHVKLDKTTPIEQQFLTRARELAPDFWVVNFGQLSPYVQYRMKGYRDGYLNTKGQVIECIQQYGMQSVRKGVIG